MLNFFPRCDDPEWMDTLDLTPVETRNCLDFLRITNQYFGGRRVIREHLKKFSRSWERNEEIRILDIASGLADIPCSLLSWADSQDFKLKITCLDLNPNIISFAKEYSNRKHEITFLNEDIFSWENTGQEFDYVTTSLFLHHVPADKLILLLEKMDRLAKRGIIISDLRRSWPGYISVKLLSGVAGNRIVRHDGPLSVRRSYQTQELHRIAQSAGLGYLTARNELFFRISLSGEKK